MELEKRKNKDNDFDISDEFHTIHDEILEHQQKPVKHFKVHYSSDYSRPRTTTKDISLALNLQGMFMN